MNAKISIISKSFETPKERDQKGSKSALQNTKSLSNTNLKQWRLIRLPKTRALFTVLRSPHIDKKSREQFEIKIHKQFIVMKTETMQLRQKLLRLKWHDLPGVQFKVIVNYTTRFSKFW
uniref:Ribosomal protein S10 n=1 Tax=Zygnema circumcarinatum TaxID=35869 RepID=A0A6N0GXM0_ZYGCR|nr:ribosomal protein S10 [Zygnema circumcarinatum]QKQ14727.1 ribosomal protein S10 [Zygnema circumcarinatum]WEL36371.1 ribosomal protein S10 [Zygnema circumcarinatum]